MRPILLGLPYQGLFAVVAAETTALARQPLPNIENRLRARDIGSAWRLLPDLQVGIVSLRSPETVESIARMLRSAATARIGVSPAYTGLEKTPQALHLARVALASSAPGSVEVCVFDDAPLAVLVASSPATSYRIAERVLGPLLQIPPDEREMLLDTLGTYFAAGARRSRPGNGCTATPTRCATACTASSVRPAVCCKTPGRAGSYLSPWRRCAGYPSRPVATPDADRIRRRRSAR